MTIIIRLIFSTIINYLKKNYKKSYFLLNIDLKMILLLFTLFYIDQKTNINIIKKNPDIISIAQLIMFTCLLLTIILFIGKCINNLLKNVMNKIIISILLILFIIILINIKNYIKVNKTRQILIVTIDSIRPDHLSLYGYKNIRTDNIDKLAKYSFTFMNAYCQAPYTSSSLASISTGCYPFHTNVRNFGMSINKKIKTIGEILTEYDYDCVAIGGPKYKFGSYTKGFRDLNISSLPVDDYIYYKIFNLINKKQIKNRTACAISYIRNNIGKSYIMWIHYWDPHAPYQPPKAYLNDRTNFKVNGSIKQIFDFMNGNERFSKEDLNYLIKLYDSEILFIDDNLGILFNVFLKKSRNNIYVITADHGEALGEYGLFLHANNLIEPMIKVPLIINCSWFIKTGRNVHQVVSSIDIVPTLLDLLQLNKFKSNFDGKSLIPLMKCNAQDYLELSYFETMGAEKIGIRYREYKMTYNLKNKKKIIYYLKGSSRIKEIIDNSLISKELENIVLDLLNISRLEDLRIYKGIIDKNLKEQLKALGYIK